MILGRAAHGFLLEQAHEHQAALRFVVFGACGGLPIVDDEAMSPIPATAAEPADTVAQVPNGTALTEADAAEGAGVPVLRDPLTLVTEQFVAVTNVRAGELDWNEAERQVARASGMPIPVGRAIKNAATSAASE